MGLWASNVKWGAGSSGDLELDAYGSYSFPIIEMLSGNVGAIGYFYPDQPSGANNNFMEFNGGLDYDLNRPFFPVRSPFLPMSPVKPRSTSMAA